MSEQHSLSAQVSAALADSAQAPQVALSLAAATREGQFKLIELVKELGPSLTSETEDERAGGVGLLSDVVAAMDKSFLDRQITKTLVTFFADKLTDKPTVVAPSLKALAELTQSASFGVGEGIEICRSVFQGINYMLFAQPTRLLVLQLIDSLMMRHRPALKRMAQEFVKGYCDLVEGEKDPRNLMVSFSLIRIICIEFPIDENLEALFDITFCYFPITFTPPPNNPFGVTSDDLVVGLRSCLAATHKFGRLALPLFLDKLQASSDKAKRQTLEALVACFPVYGAAISGEWAGRFSEACTVEVFHPTSEEISALALETLRTLFATLYPDEAPVHRVHVNDSEGDAEMEVAMDEEAEVKGIAVDVVANAMNELREPDKRDAGEAVKLVCAAIASSRRVARYAFAVALPPLLSIFKSQDDISLRPSVLEHVSSMLAALARLPPPPDPDEPSPLNPYRDDLLSVLASGTRTATCRHPAIAALVHAFHVAYFLDPLEEVPFVVAALKDALDAVAPTVANGGGDAAVYDATLDALVEASKLYPHAIEKAVLPAKFALLPDADDPLASLNAPNELASAPGMPPAHIRALASLAALCVPPDLFEILALRVLARLERVGALAPADPRDAALGAKYAHELLATLRAALVQKARAGHDDVARYVDRFLPNFVAIFIAPTVRPPLPGAPPSIASDSRLLQDAGNVLQLIVQRLPLEGQRNLVEALHRAFHSGEISALVPSWRAAEGDLPFAPFSRQSGEAQQDLILLYAGMILAMRPAALDAAAGDGGVARFARALLDRIADAKASERQLIAYNHLLAGKINKQAPALDDFLGREVPEFWRDWVCGEQIPTSATPRARVSLRKHSLSACVWIAKGLAVRSDKRGYDILSRVLELVDSPSTSAAEPSDDDDDLAMLAANSLQIIVDEQDGVLTKDNYSVLRILHRQRFFAFVLPRLVQIYDASASHGRRRARSLVALANLLKHMPKQISHTEMPKLLPLLVSALELEDELINASVLETLTTLLIDTPPGASDGVLLGDDAITDLVGKAVRILERPAGRLTSSDTRVRLAALAFVSAVPSRTQYYAIHPHKPRVLRTLGVAIDDKRRRVRRAAVDARSAWYSAK